MRIHEIASGATESLVARAVRHFGLTTHPLEAGYLLPDGRLLDLSGRHQQQDSYRRVGDRWEVKRGNDYQKGRRETDHRDLDDLVAAGGTEGMFAFMRETGAIRLLPGNGFSLLSFPTSMQLKVMGLLLRAYLTQTDVAQIDCDDSEGRTLRQIEVRNERQAGPSYLTAQLRRAYN